MNEYTIQVGEVFTEEKAKELKEYLEMKDEEIAEMKSHQVNIKTPEKPANIVITHRSIMGALASCAVQQSPYHRPDNLEIVLDKFHEQIKDQFDEGKKYIMKFNNYTEIKDWLEPKLKSIPEFMLWNERKNGNQAPYGFTGAGHHDNGDVTFFTEKADNDFIDLDALIRNVINKSDND